MRRSLTNHALPVLVIALVSALLVRPAAAEIYAANESLCESSATSPKPRSASDFETMTDACAVAAHWHETQAEGAHGAERQQQMLLQATYLYFAAEGEAGLHRYGVARTVLKRSRALYRAIYAHAENASLRRKARRGLDVVAEALTPIPHASAPPQR